MLELFWRWAARQLARPRVTDWLIRRAMRTPYTHITGPDGTIYMERYWLFNPYPAHNDGRRPWWQFPVSIRLHRIVREDQDRHHHDHPWNARSIILRGAYAEKRGTETWARGEGETVTLKFGQYHRIIEVTRGGVWTMFITGRYQGTWGFLVDGVKVPWREYLK